MSPEVARPVLWSVAILALIWILASRVFRYLVPEHFDRALSANESPDQFEMTGTRSHVVWVQK